MSSDYEGSYLSILLSSWRHSILHQFPRPSDESAWTYQSNLDYCQTPTEGVIAPQFFSSHFQYEVIFAINF